MSPPLTHTRYSVLPHPVHVCQWDSHEIILLMNLLTICLFLLESKYDNGRNLFWLARSYILVWGTVFGLQEIVSASWITEPRSETATRQHGFSEPRGSFTNLSIRKNLNPFRFYQVGWARYSSHSLEYWASDRMGKSDSSLWCMHPLCMLDLKF